MLVSSKFVRSCTLNIAMAYLAFRRIVAVDWANESIVRWLPYNAGNGVLYAEVDEKRDREVGEEA